MTKNNDQEEESGAAAMADAVEFLEGLLKRLQLEGEVSSVGDPEAGVVLQLDGNAAEALRRDPELTAAMGGLARQVLSRAGGSGVRCRLDVGAPEVADRSEVLEGIAHGVASLVVGGGRSVVLEGLAPNERRVIHTTLAEDDEVRTRSADEDAGRVLVVEPA